MIGKTLNANRGRIHCALNVRSSWECRAVASMICGEYMGPKRIVVVSMKQDDSHDMRELQHETIFREQCDVAGEDLEDFVLPKEYDSCTCFCDRCRSHFDNNCVKEKRVVYCPLPNLAELLHVRSQEFHVVIFEQLDLIVGETEHSPVVKKLLCDVEIAISIECRISTLSVKKLLAGQAVPMEEEYHCASVESEDGDEYFAEFPRVPLSPFHPIPCIMTEDNILSTLTKKLSSAEEDWAWDCRTRPSMKERTRRVLIAAFHPKMVLTKLVLQHGFEAVNEDDLLLPPYSFNQIATSSNPRKLEHLDVTVYKGGYEDYTHSHMTGSRAAVVVFDFEKLCSGTLWHHPPPAGWIQSVVGFLDRERDLDLQVRALSRSVYPDSDYPEHKVTMYITNNTLGGEKAAQRFLCNRFLPVYDDANDQARQSCVPENVRKQIANVPASEVEFPSPSTAIANRAVQNPIAVAGPSFRDDEHDDDDVIFVGWYQPGTLCQSPQVTGPSFSDDVHEEDDDVIFVEMYQLGRRSRPPPADDDTVAKRTRLN